jgi:hypothetical protein
MYFGSQNFGPIYDFQNVAVVSSYVLQVPQLSDKLQDMT